MNPTLLGGLIGLGGGVIGKGIDFGLGQASSQLAYKQARKLRRREYQDMVYSLKKAGLNPALAFGSSPGHTAAQMGHIGTGAIDLSGGVSATAKQTEAATGKETGATIQALNEATEQLRDIEKGNALLQGNNIVAQHDNTVANTALAEQKAIEAAAAAAKNRQDAIRSGADASKIKAEEERIRATLPLTKESAEVKEGVLKGGRSAWDAIKTLPSNALELGKELNRGREIEMDTMREFMEQRARKQRDKNRRMRK